MSNVLVSPPEALCWPWTCTQHGETGNFPPLPWTLVRKGSEWRPGPHLSESTSVLSRPQTPKSLLLAPPPGAPPHVPSPGIHPLQGSVDLHSKFTVTSSRPGRPTRCPAWQLHALESRRPGPGRDGRPRGCLLPSSSSRERPGRPQRHPGPLQPEIPAQGPRPDLTSPCGSDPDGHSVQADCRVSPSLAPGHPRAVGGGSCSGGLWLCS